MGRRKLNLDQQSKLDAVSAFDDSFAQLKRTARAEVQRMVDERLAAASAELDRLVRVAVDAGVPKEEFRRPEHGLHTTNRQRVLDILARTESLRETMEAVEVTAGPSLFAFDGGLLVITPPRDVVDDLAARLDLEPDTVTPYSARFRITPTGRLDAVDGVKIPGTIDRNPVVMWAYKPENETAALEWLKQHRV